MPLTIELQDEDGGVIDSVEDVRNVLTSAAGRSSLPPSAMLRHIDPYGDTTLNRLQVPHFLGELSEVRPLLNDAEVAVVESVAALARRVRDEIHVYLKFIGD